jgi:hypothetical protein
MHYINTRTFVLDLAILANALKVFIVVSTVAMFDSQSWTKAVSAALKSSRTPAFPPHSGVL